MIGVSAMKMYETNIWRTTWCFSSHIFGAKQKKGKNRWPGSPAETNRLGLSHIGGMKITLG